MLVSKSNLDGVEVLALYVFHKSHLHHRLVLNGADISRNTVETCHLCGSPSAFARNYLVFAVFHLSEGHGLYDTNLAYAVSQFLHSLLVEFASGLVGIG